MKRLILLTAQTRDLLIQLTSAHIGASAHGCTIGVSRVGIVKSTIVKSPDLLD